MISPETPGSSAALPVPDRAVLAAARNPEVPLGHLIDIALAAYGERPALFWRKTRPVGLDKSFSSISYSALRDQVIHIRSIWLSADGFGLKPGDSIAVVAFAGPEYVAIVLAAMASGLVLVPLASAGKSEPMCAIADETQPKVVVSSIEHLHLATDIALAVDNLRLLLVLDYDHGIPVHREEMSAAERRLQAAAPGTALLSFTEALAQGAGLPKAPPYGAQTDADNLSAIFYTSGSTGAPKGAMYTEKHTRAFWAMASEQPQVILHYQPMSHTFGMSWVCMVLASGGQIYFTARSDLSTLLEDAAMAQPTNIALVPRVCELIYQRANADRRGSADVDFDDLRRRLLGGRIAMATTGSAPLAPELKQFIERLLGFPLIDGYGTTETGMIAVNGVIQSPPVLDYRLLDVPELGYFSTDRPHPRGELAVRTNRLIKGYFKRDDLNRSLVDDDGFYHTGDIMEEIEPHTIRYLDRRNNVLKLAQGEFVAIAKLEALFAGGSPLIRQIFLYGNSARSFLLGVVVPNHDAMDGERDDAAVRIRILDAIRQIGVEAGLAAYEVPRDIILENAPFTAANGLLAGVGKLLRPALLARYQGQLEAIYAQMARNQEDDLAYLRANVANLPVEQVVLRGAALVLGLMDAPTNVETTFAELGGDSLSAVSFSLLLEELFGTAVEVNEVLGPTGSFGWLARKIAQDLQPGSAQRPGFGAVHGDGCDKLLASALTLDRFLPATLLADADANRPLPEGRPQYVVLTGANGFLGRFLCLEWLERMAGTDGRVACICRGKDREDAANRLREAFDSGDKELLARFDELARDHLDVFAGDLGQKWLGLDQETWDTLAARADLIVHSAALVNHRLPYRQLFQPNVVGTSEIIGLALTGRRKRIINISTIAAARSASGDLISEQSDIRAAIPKWQLGGEDDYAQGYAASKWAAEALLRDAAERFGIPVVNFRSNMILAHRVFRGQLNVPDIFTRWVISLVLTGVAPASFYAGSATHAHYEGLPVDFVARAVVGIGEEFREGFHTFHAVNPHDDGISLDSFVDWIAAAGHSIQRLADFADWRTRFEQALSALPENLRARSSLPVISMFDAPTPVAAKHQILAPDFVAAVDQALEKGAIPHLDHAFINKYLEDIKVRELI